MHFTFNDPSYFLQKFCEMHSTFVTIKIYLFLYFSFKPLLMIKNKNFVFSVSSQTETGNEIRGKLDLDINERR